MLPLTWGPPRTLRADRYVSRRDNDPVPIAGMRVRSRLTVLIRRRAMRDHDKRRIGTGYSL